MSSICIGLLSIYIVKNCMQVMLNVYLARIQVEYLGHIIGGGVIAVDPAKMCAIMD